METLDSYRLLARERLSSAQDTLKGIQALAGAAPHWLPGRGLQSECRTALDLVAKMGERLERKLVITLIGPSGAGKSTLLNALSGDDRLSPTGNNRPTTRGVVVFCRARADAELLLRDLDPDPVTVAPHPEAVGLDNIILVDTPDMDSLESKPFHPLLEKTIALTDVLVCVLNAENPKRRDTLVFLKPFVELFPGAALLVVLNRVDRLPEEELKGVVLPDLENHLEASWQRPVDQIFSISARQNLQDPGWPEGEKPLHGYDQFPQLRELIFGILNRAGRLADARLERAQHLVELVRRSVRSRLAERRPGLVEVRKEILELEQQGARAAAAVLKEGGSEMLTGIQALFYQRLAGRWWGPIGWLVALWARFLMAGAGLLATLRFGNPVVQLWGLMASLIRYRKTSNAVEEAASGGEMAGELTRYRLIIRQAWPEKAGKLIALGFDHGVRDAATVLTDEKVLQQRLASSWKTALEGELERRTAGLSGFGLQLFFNLPTLAFLGLFAYQSVKSFLLQEILSTGYFLQAAVSVFLVWVLSFVGLQVLVRMVSGRRLIRRSFERLLEGFDSRDLETSSRAIIREIDAVLRLDDSDGLAG